ncbi:MAG: hypothetical protein SFT94_11535 [Pseudanabaenaceae cyanobacterium bins.68]|nr:hypothetical protein [Pseudanabaenaceae cyanobacterium bins.68]
MPASKLTAELKQQVIALYQDTEISIGQLAEQFGVSSSTISRLLQSSLTEQEYQTLVKQKKTKRSAEPPEQSDQINQLDLITPEIPDLASVSAKPKIPAPIPKSAKLVEQELAEEIIEAVNDDFNLDEFDQEEEEDETLEEIEDNGTYIPTNSNVEVQIYPLERAELPSICYMVVDKTAEIITQPLKHFKEIGKIPSQEEGQLTLAIFSNHRVAKRFSRQNQRIIKFSGNLIYITHERLAARGITRLLFEGRVYAL